MASLQLVNGRPQMQPDASSPTIYYQQSTLGSSISNGTAITLPSSGTYTSSELEIYVNGVFQYLTEDWNTVGSAPRTQVTLTRDLEAGDILLFRKMRNP